MRYTIFILCFLSPMISYGFEFTAKSEQVEECYGKAMIGLDSVINSRLGVPPEHAIYLTNSDNLGIEEDGYYNEVLIIILDAYLWIKSPHSYAVNVFYECAANNSTLKNARFFTDPQ